MISEEITKILKESIEKIPFCERIIISSTDGLVIKAYPEFNTGENEALAASATSVLGLAQATSISIGKGIPNYTLTTSMQGFMMVLGEERFSVFILAGKRSNLGLLLLNGQKLTEKLSTIIIPGQTIKDNKNAMKLAGDLETAYKKSSSEYFEPTIVHVNEPYEPTFEPTTEKIVMKIEIAQEEIIEPRLIKYHNDEEQQVREPFKPTEPMLEPIIEVIDISPQFAGRREIEEPQFVKQVSESDDHGEPSTHHATPIEMVEQHKDLIIEPVLEPVNEDTPLEQIQHSPSSVAFHDVDYEDGKQESVHSYSETTKTEPSDPRLEPLIEPITIVEPTEQQVIVENPQLILYHNEDIPVVVEPFKPEEPTLEPIHNYDHNPKPVEQKSEFDEYEQPLPIQAPEVTQDEPDLETKPDEDGWWIKPNQEKQDEKDEVSPRKDDLFKW